jgi:hypothetical protein
LTANCTGGDAVDSWTWSGPTSTSSGNTATASITTQSAFGVTATNGGGSGTGSLTVSVSGGGGGGGGGPVSCSGYLSTKVLTMNWPNWFSNQALSMGPLDAGVVVFTTGATTSSSPTAAGQFYATAAPDANPSTTHDFSLSTVPCDFGGPATLKSLTGAGTAKIGFVIGQPTARGINLQPNTTYYVNIRNSSDGFSCIASGGSCNVNPINLQKPN